MIWPMAEKFQELHDHESADDDDVSPKVIYDLNSPNPVLPEPLAGLAVLAIDFFNKKNSACLGCEVVHLVKVTSEACNGLLLNLEVAAKRTSSPADADPHIFKSKIWYKSTGSINDPFEVLYCQSPPSFDRSLSTGDQKESTTSGVEKINTEDPLPDSFSWKEILDSTIPIRDQKLSPCSWAFAAATLVSYELRISNIEVWDYEASAQHLIDKCQTESSEMLNKTRGETCKVLEYIEEHGVSLQSRYPFRARKCSNQEIPTGPKIRIENICLLPKSTPLAKIKKILMKHPILASIGVYQNLLPGPFPQEQEAMGSMMRRISTKYIIRGVVHGAIVGMDASRASLSGPLLMLPRLILMVEFILSLFYAKSTVLSIDFGIRSPCSFMNVVVVADLFIALKWYLVRSSLL